MPGSRRHRCGAEHDPQHDAQEDAADQRNAQPREKPIGWRGASYNELLAFPAEARRAAGYQLHRIQQGNAPDDWKPMASVGPGTIEIRVHTETEHRVFLVSKFAEAVYVLHAFEKKTQKTPAAALELARQRYRALAAERRADTRSTRNEDRSEDRRGERRGESR